MITKTIIETKKYLIDRNTNIRQLTFVPLEDSEMNWILKIIKALLAVLPLKSIGKIILNWAEERTQDTANNWDDAALYALWVVLYSLDMADVPPDDLKARAKQILPTF